MFSVLAFLLVLFSGSFFGVSVLRRRFTECLPITAGGMVLLLFVFGLLGSLRLGFYIVLFMAALLYIVSFRSSAVNHAWLENLKQIFSADFLIFLFAALVFLICDYGMETVGWDAFSHWMDTVKVMTIYDDFGTNPSANTFFPSYPPGVALFQYVLQKLYLILDGGQFSEWRAVYSYKILTLSMLAPLFRRIRFESVLGILLAVLSVMIIPGVFNSDFYCSVLIDPFLGIMSGTGFAYLIAFQNEKCIKTLLVSSAAFLLVLTKDVGLLFAVMLVIGILICECRSQKLSWRSIWPSIMVMGMTILPKILWNCHLSARDVNRRFHRPVDVQELIALIFQRDSSWRQTCWNSFFPQLCNEKKSVGWILPVKLPHIAWFAVCIALACLLLFLIRRRSPGSFAVSKCVFAVIVFQGILYVFGMAVTYVFQFDEAEGSILASFDRYIGIVFYGMMVVLLSFGFELSNAESQERYKPYGTILCIVLLLFAAPLGILRAYLSRMTVDWTQEQRFEIDKISEAIQESVSPGESIWLVAQQDNGGLYYPIKFCIRPIQAQKGMWSFTNVPRYDDDLYFYEYKISADDWLDLLCESYDAVFLITTDDFFLENYGELFEDQTEIQNNTIYSIDHQNRKLVRISS